MQPALAHIAIFLIRGCLLWYCWWYTALEPRLDLGEAVLVVAAAELLFNFDAWRRLAGNVGRIGRAREGHL